MASMPRKRDFDLQAKGLGLSSFCPDTWQKGGSGPMKTVWAHGLGADEALGWEGETQTVLAAPLWVTGQGTSPRWVLIPSPARGRYCLGQLFSHLPYSQKYLFKQDMIGNPNGLSRVMKEVKPRQPGLSLNSHPPHACTHAWPHTCAHTCVHTHRMVLGKGSKHLSKIHCSMSHCHVTIAQSPSRVLS